MPNALEGMTHERWTYLTADEKDAIRDNSDLCPQLIGLEGWRVEVVNEGEYHSQRRRFIVGKSTGWRPCHLEMYNRRSRRGHPAYKRYQSVRKLEKVR